MSANLLSVNFLGSSDCIFPEISSISAPFREYLSIVFSTLILFSPRIQARMQYLPAVIPPALQCADAAICQHYNSPQTLSQLIIQFLFAYTVILPGFHVLLPLRDLQRPLLHLCVYFFVCFLGNPHGHRAPVYQKFSFSLFVDHYRMGKTPHGVEKPYSGKALSHLHFLRASLFICKQNRHARIRMCTVPFWSNSPRS